MSPSQLKTHGLQLAGAVTSLTFTQPWSAWALDGRGTRLARCGMLTPVSNDEGTQR